MPARRKRGLHLIVNDFDSAVARYFERDNKTRLKRVKRYADELRRTLIPGSLAQRLTDAGVVIGQLLEMDEL